MEWVPDTYLVGSGFVDATTGQPYDPADYPNHGSGLFFVGLEANGIVYVYALDQTSSSFDRVASFASGFPTFAALHWDADENQLWVVCDNNCDGRSRLFEVNSNGVFAVVAEYARPTGMANLNNEGFTITPDSECVAGSKPVYWADDGNTASHALRAGTIPCTPASPPIGRAGWSAPTDRQGRLQRRRLRRPRGRRAGRELRRRRRPRPLRERERARHGGLAVLVAGLRRDH